MSAFPSLPLFTDAFIADTGQSDRAGDRRVHDAPIGRVALSRVPPARRGRKARSLARVDRRTWLRIKPTVMGFWTLRDGFWTQKRLSSERDIVSKRADVARSNGKHGGRPKSLEDNDPDNPTGSSRVTHRKAPNPNPIIPSSLRSEGARSRADEIAKTPIDPDWGAR